MSEQLFKIAELSEINKITQGVANLTDLPG